MRNGFGRNCKMDEQKDKAVDQRYEKLVREAKTGGYNLNPDVDFTKELIKGLITNESRYGYEACPCRLAEGNKKGDLDIICPCDYRDPDLYDHQACFCGLYVSDEIAEGKGELSPVPERRDKRCASLPVTEQKDTRSTSLPHPVYRCKVCGYLCANEHPPGVCPVCKAKRDRFERFI